MRKLLLLLPCLIMSGCFYDADNQKEILKEMPDSKIFKIQNLSNRYVVLTNDSTVYVVGCTHLTDCEISEKHFLFSFKK